MAQPTSTDRGNRFSFVADLQSRDGGLTKDARIHNAFVEADGGTAAVWQRPALGSGVAGSGGGQGLLVDGSGIYSIAGGTLKFSSPQFSLVIGTAPAPAAGSVFLYNGAIYRVDLSSGAISRTSPGRLSWQTVSTAGTTIPNSSKVNGLWEVAGSVWGYFSGNGSDWQVFQSTDGALSWVANGAVLEGAAAGFVTGFGGNGYRYPTTFTNGATLYRLIAGTGGGTFAAGTMSFPAATSLIPSAVGTGGGYVWVLGSGASNVLLAKSSDGASFSMAGTGTLSLSPSGVAVNRMAYLANALFTPFGVGTAGGIVSIPPVGAWSTVGTFGAPLSSSGYRAITPGNSNPYILGNIITPGLQGTMSLSGSFGAAVNVAGATLSVTPLGVLRSRTNNYIVMQGTDSAYIYNTVNGTSGKIAGTNFPTNMVPGMVFLDDTYYVMDLDGTVWNSTGAADDPTTWPTDGFIQASFEPDDGVALTKALNYIVAMGKWSVELFWDAGNPTGSPLSPVNNGVLLIGCAAAGSIAQTESTIVWVAQRKGGGSTAQKGRFVAILVGTEYKDLSTPSVSRILDADDLATVYASIIELGGHTWYVLGLGTSNITLVYDFETKLWYTWSRLAVGSPVTISSITQTNGLASGITGSAHGISDGDPVVIAGVTPAGFNGTLNVNVSGTTGFSYPLNTSGTSTGTGASMTVTPYTESYFDTVAVAGLGNMQLVQDTSGNVFTFSLGTYSDLSNLPLNVKLRTNNIDGGNNENKFCHSIAVLGDILASQGYGLLRTTDDDFQTYTNYRRFDLSQTRSNEQRWGKYRRRAYEWRFTGAVQHRLRYLEPDITQGVT